MKTVLVILKILLVLISILIILSIAYLFGWPVLEGHLKGNDVGFYLAVTDWVSRYFPFAPQWYPLAGGGVSLLQATQVGAYYLSVMFSKISFLALGQSIRIVELASVFVIALELYFIAWYFFRSQITALLAAIFFLIMQPVWSMVIEIGMLPQITSLVFVLPAFFFFEVFLDKKQAPWLVGAVFSFALAVLSHLITGALLVEWFIAYGLLRAFLLSQKGILRELAINLFWAFLTIAFGFALVAFWFLPFLRYLSIASRNLIVTLAFEQIDYFDLGHLLGLAKSIGPWENFFPLPILLLSFISFLLAIFQTRGNPQRKRENRLVIILGILSVAFLIYSALPGLAPWLVKRVMISVVTGTYARGFLITLIIMPLLSAWACQTLAQTVLLPLRKFSGIVRIAIPFLTLGLAFFFLLTFSRAPSYYEKPCYRGFGMGQIPEINYCHFWEKLNKIKGVSQEGTPWDELTSNLAQKLNLSEKHRIDISPNLGPIIMNWPRFSSSSIISLYAITAGINNIFTGYFGGAFYGKNQDFGTPEEVANLASWFGIERVVLRPSVDPQERFTSDFWQTDFDLSQSGPLDILALTNKNHPGLVTLSSQPKILILGKFSNRAYEQFFRLANAGAYPYGKAMFVEGKDEGRIDDYSSEELKKFEMIFLYGYTYKNQQKAFDLLKNYVKEGGRLFIETGWQYVSPDWQLEVTPEIIPVKKLAWKEFKGDWIEGFSPADYKGGPWGASTASLQDLKSWAKSEINIGEDVLVASGNLGQGKIVWSGMNLPAHAFMYRNKNEYILFESLVDDLLTGLGGEDKTNQVSWERINPDKIEFTFSQSQENVWLYWRENFYPDWQARLSTGEKLKIYRAGPNFMLMPLENVGEGGKVILELKKSKTYILSRIISVVTFLILLLILYNVKILKNLSGKISGKFGLRFSTWWNKE